MAELSHIDFNEELLEIADEEARKNIAFMQEKVNSLTDATIRYVNDESDENFGWIQVKDAEGEWTNYRFAGINDKYVWMDGVDNGDFVGYAGSTTNNGNPNIAEEAEVIKGEELLTVQFSSAVKVGSAVTRAYDVTSYTSLVFSYTTFASIANGSTKVYVFLTKELKREMTPDVEFIAMQNDTGKTATQTLDISNLSGMYYIGIALTNNDLTNKKPAGISISEMYFE